MGVWRIQRCRRYVSVTLKLSRRQRITTRLGEYIRTSIDQTLQFTGDGSRRRVDDSSEQRNN